MVIFKIFALGAILLSLSACTGAGEGIAPSIDTPSESLPLTGLSLSAPTNGVVVSGTLQFTSAGGLPPYQYSVASGDGSIAASTGLYTAPATSSSVVVQVLDSNGNSTTKNILVSAAPTISNIASFDLAQGVSVAIPFSISDDFTVLSCDSTFVSATSTNPAVIPLTSITFSGIAPNCFANFTTAAAAGSSDITLSVTDLSSTASAALFTVSAFEKPTMAFSFRRVVKDWSGFAVEVRRASDDATQNIGFDVNGDFNLTAYNSFIAGGTGHIITWYDQSGHNYHATQNIKTAQPTINLVGFSGKPQVEFNGTTWLETTQTENVISNARDLTVFFAAKATTQSQNNFGSWNPGNSSDRISIHLNWSDNNIYWDSPALCCSTGRLSFGNAANVGVPKAYVFARDNNNQYIVINGTSVASRGNASGTYGAASTLWYLGSTGAYGSGTAPLAEYIQFKIGLSANKVQLITNEQQNYFGI